MKSILIRAEDKNLWESRAPIIPEHLKEIIERTGVPAYVQKSDIRFFNAKDYESAGARITDDMNTGDVIIGIKEIPEHKLLDDKVYIFFSHTIKGQSHNMPMLKKILNGGSTLIDYEKILDDRNRRLIYFGRYAGDAGAIDILWLMGEHWEHHGIWSPFADIKQATHYRSVEEAKSHMRRAGEFIQKTGFSDQIAPVVIGLLGYGNVSQGAQQIFDCLPIERIEPGQLKPMIDQNRLDAKHVYLTVFKEEHLVRHKAGKSFELQDYYQHPELYLSQFDDYLPYISILVNAIYWDKRYPRFVTWDSLARLGQDKKSRLKGIADISCDINGSIECTVKATNTGVPAFLCDPVTRSIVDGHKGDGIVVLAVDNLPCELPHDASEFFSNQFKPFLPQIIQADYDRPLADSGLSPEIQSGVIAYNGELTPSYKYLEQYLK